VKLPPKLGWIDMMMDDVYEYWHRVFHFSPLTVLFNSTGQPAIDLGQNHPLAVEPFHVVVPREQPQLASEWPKRIMC
jgi:hypothetical protein